MATFEGRLTLCMLQRRLARWPTSSCCVFAKIFHIMRAAYGPRKCLPHLFGMVTRMLTYPDIAACIAGFCGAGHLASPAPDNVLTRRMTNVDNGCKQYYNVKWLAVESSRTGHARGRIGS